jgi:putative aminopeptidase FrvX
VFDQEEEDFLKKYINTASPSGHESHGQQVWLEYVKPYTHTYFVDIYGSVAAVINPDAPYKVVLEAHVDQISFYVNYIDKNGYIYVAKNGGANPVMAPSKWVQIHTQKGVIEGIFGWPAPHVKNSKSSTPEIDTIFVDTGCRNRKEVAELGIEVGDVITFKDQLGILNNRLYTGPSLDNCIGGFMLAQIARLLHQQKIKLPYGLYLVNSVQEEVGKNGALLMANNIIPDVAIVTDVTHDTQSPMYDKKIMGDIAIGEGPVITVSPTVQNNVRKMLVEVAMQHKIPFQKKAASKSTGTDADAFAFADSGVASALVSIPLKYMHSTVESAHKKDVEATLRLLYEFLKQLPAGHDFRYFT